MKQYIPLGLLSLGIILIVVFVANMMFFSAADRVKKEIEAVEQQEKEDQGCNSLPYGEKIAFDTTDYDQYQDSNRLPETIYPEDGEVAEIFYNVFEPGNVSVCVEHGKRIFYLVKDDPETNGRYIVYFDGKYAGTRILEGRNSIDIIQDTPSEKFGALRKSLMHTHVMVKKGSRPYEEEEGEDEEETFEEEGEDGEEALEEEDDDGNDEY